jgi:hypothetical protein
MPAGLTSRRHSRSGAGRRPSSRANGLFDLASPVFRPTAQTRAMGTTMDGIRSGAALLNMFAANRLFRCRCQLFSPRVCRLSNGARSFFLARYRLSLIGMFTIRWSLRGIDRRRSFALVSFEVLKNGSAFLSNSRTLATASLGRRRQVHRTLTLRAAHSCAINLEFCSTTA